MSMRSARFLGGESGRTDRRSTTGLSQITSHSDKRDAPHPPGSAYFGHGETCAFDAGQSVASLKTPPPTQVVRKMILGAR